MTQSASSQCLAFLKEIGVGNTVKMSEINAHVQTASGGGLHGFVNRATKEGALSLEGAIQQKGARPDRLFRVLPAIHKLNCRQNHKAVVGYTREPGLTRPNRCTTSVRIKTQAEMRDCLLDVAAFLDRPPLEQFTVQELVAELGRRYAKGEK